MCACQKFRFEVGRDDRIEINEHSKGKNGNKEKGIEVEE